MTTKNPAVTESPAQISFNTKMERGIIFSCAGLILLHFMASFFPHLRLWGINQLAYFPVQFRIGVTAVGLLFLIPVINGILFKVLKRAFTWLINQARKVNRYLIFAFISLFSFLLFWILSVKTPLLGDGYWRAAQIKPGILFSLTEPLDFYLHLLVSRLFHLDGYTAYRVLSCSVGVIYIFIVFLICDQWGKDAGKKIFIFLILITMGANQLFFGYIESYSIMYVLLAVYLYFGIRYQMQGRGFVWLCFFLIIASGFHLAALSFLPSLVYLAFIKSINSTGIISKKTRIQHIFGLGFVILMLAIGMYWLRITFSRLPVNPFLIYPFGAEESFYSFFSVAHLLDFLNQQLLISPLIIIMGVILLVLGRGAVDFKAKVTGIFVWTMVGSFIFAWFVDPKLGYARDWDLFAFTGLGATFLAMALFLSILEKGKPLEPGRMTLALFVTAFVFILPWIWINASPEKSIARFEDLLTIDKDRADYGYETLACYFRDKGEDEKTAIYWKKAIALNPNPRYFGALGNAYLRLKRPDLAREVLEQGVRREPDGLTLQLLHSSLGRCLAEMGKYDEAALEIRKAISLNPKNPEYYYTLGNILGMAGKYQEAAPCFETAIRLDPKNIKAYKYLGMTYARMGKKDQAKRLLETYLKSVSQDTSNTKGIIDSIQIELEPK